jgi:extracellular factor (EF) 3-hydroxypalmitic acid methyl ester biosynthesis protein
MIYGKEEGWPLPETSSELGRQILQFTTDAPASEAVRARRGFIANVVDRLAGEVTRPHILSVAAGHLREALLCAAVKRRKLGRYVALDADRDSLDEVQRCYGGYGVEPVLGSVRKLLCGQLDLGQFDFAYSMGLFDYLPATAAKRLTSTLFQTLRSRGQLLVANFLPGIPDVGYMETYMDWKLIYRNRQEMLELAANIPDADIREIRLFADDSQNIIFLQITKR